MISSGLTRLLTGIVIAVAVPGIACFGWYSTDSIGNMSAAVRTLVIIAYPATLIALVFLILAFISGRRKRYQIWLSAFFLVASAAVVLFARM